MLSTSLSSTSCEIRPDAVQQRTERGRSLVVSLLLTLLTRRVACAMLRLVARSLRSHAVRSTRHAQTRYADERLIGGLDTQRRARATRNEPASFVSAALDISR